MPATKHLAVRDALAAVYQAAPPLAGGRIKENRDVTLPEGVASLIQVYRVESNPERSLMGESAPIDWTTVLRTAIKARRAGAESAEVIADALAAECYARVMADQTLGGLVGLLEPGAFTWDQDEMDNTVVVVTWDVSVQHRTEFNTLT